MISRTKNKVRSHQSRSGVAATEFAVILPVIVIVFLTATSAIAQVSLKRNLQLVALAAATEVSNPSNALADVESHYEAFAADLGIRDVDLSIQVHDGRIHVIQATAPQLGNNPITTPGSTAEVSVNCYVYR